VKPAARQIILLGLLVLGVWFYETMRPVPQPPGVLAPDPPRVSELTQKARTFVRNEYVYTALAGLDLRARILSIERYGRDRESQVALLDVVLGWGRMSDSKTLKNVDVAQTERRVISKSYDPALPDAEVESSILNLHLVTANPETEKMLRQLRAGNIVRLEGYLVEAVAGDGWRWKGQIQQNRVPALPGALLWVEQLEVEQTQPVNKS
jgi:hypothetical protein